MPGKWEAVLSPLAAHLAAALDRYSPQERELAARFLQDMVRATVEARADIPQA